MLSILTESMEVDKYAYIEIGPCQYLHTYCLYSLFWHTLKRYASMLVVVKSDIHL